MSYPKLTKGDVLVLILAVAVAIFSYGYYWQGMNYANQAQIRVHGKHWTTLDLYQNQLIKIKGKLGESTLEVRDGKVRFIDSPCTTKQCVHQGWLQHGGEMAACLPNEISVQVMSADPLYDTMNF